MALCSWLAATAAGAQTVVRWDTALFDQPGQRSLFLRNPNGGTFGLPLGVGDVNEDGREDTLLCAFAASEAFLFFSPPVIGGIREAVPAPGEVTRIAGAPSLGVECAAGDVNRDGSADLVLGAPNVAAPGRSGAGAVYVVFGSPSLPAQVDVEASGGVLKIVGTDAGDHFGVWVDAVDVDGDGAEDLLIGAPDADGPANARQDAGEAYVIFGGSDLVAGSFELGAFGSANRLFTAFGAEAFDKAGSAVDAGRIDGNATAELVVGSALNRAAQAVFNGASGAADGPDGSREDAGEVAILFDPPRGGNVDLATPGADVAFVFGADGRDFAGEEVDVGDADGDGFGDVMIGALTANGLGNLRGDFAGEAYLVYGGASLRGRRIDLAQPPAGVTVFYGPTAGGITGDTARLIDIDGDGRGDPFIGSPTGTFLGPDGRARTGALFFVRSPAGRLPSVIDFDDPPLGSLPVGIILAADPGDILAYSLVKADADGDGVDDVLVNGMTGSGLNNQFPAAGEAYVIDGQTLAGRLEPFATGDVNADGSADVRDLQRVIAALVGRVQLSDAERRAADTNGNGALDVGDLIGVVDRVLQRNALAPGSLGTGNLAKEAETPGYRYEELSRPAERGERVSGATFSLVERTPSSSGSPAASAGPGGSALGRRAEVPHALGALLATFAPPERAGALLRVVASEGARVFTGTEQGKLRVLVLADRVLPLGRPLFGFAGSAPRLESVTAATLGGSVRRLEEEAGPSFTRRMEPRSFHKDHKGGFRRGER